MNTLVERSDTYKWSVVELGIYLALIEGTKRAANFMRSNNISFDIAHRVLILKRRRTPVEIDNRFK